VAVNYSFKVEIHKGQKLHVCWKKNPCLLAIAGFFAKLWSTQNKFQPNLLDKAGALMSIFNFDRIFVYVIEKLREFKFQPI
jgi:hypothetical protein